MTNRKQNDRWTIQPGSVLASKSPTLQEAAETMRRALVEIGIHDEKQQIYFMRNAYANESMKCGAPLSDGKAWFYGCLSLGLDCSHPPEYRYVMPLELRKKYPNSQADSDEPFRAWECIACESTAVDYTNHIGVDDG